MHCRHHCNIDRIFEAFLAERERVDGNRDAVEAEFATSRRYKDVLTPFTKPNGDDWTSQGTLSTAPFNYTYDTLPSANFYVVRTLRFEPRR